MKGIFNTHAHIDHIGAVSQIVNEFQIPFYLHELDEELLDSIPQYAQLFGLSNIEIRKVNYNFEDESYQIDEINLHILLTPGHTKGGVCFLIGNHLFTGDTLFNNSIGRTDLPGGNYSTLISSIKEVLYNLPENTVVYPGHGENTSIGNEKLHNPFTK